MINRFPIITTLLIMLLLPNCEELLTEKLQDEVTEQDRLEADALVDEANEALFKDLGAMVDTELESEDVTDTPGTTLQNTIDLNNSYGKYEQALALDPENTGANFGIGFMEVAMASQDDGMETTLNKWAECLDSLGIYDDESTRVEDYFIFPSQDI